MVGIRPRDAATAIRISMLSAISLDVQTSPLLPGGIPTQGRSVACFR